MRVVVADGVPGVHAGEDGVGGGACGYSTPNLKRILPDDLGEMGPVTTRLYGALLSVKGCKDRCLAVPLVDDGILKSTLKSPGIRGGRTLGGNVLAVSTAINGPVYC